MNYVYDIVLNLNKKLYNFYEWEDSDKVDFYLKIPIFKIEEDVMKDFIKNDICVSSDFLNRIYKKSDVFLPNKVKHNEYVSLFVSMNSCIAIEFDNKGKSVNKSYLSIDEEDEILEYSKSIKYTLINYSITRKNSSSLVFTTRNEKEDKKYILDLIENLYKTGKNELLNYLFLEVYGIDNLPVEKERIKLINVIEGNSDKYEKLKSIIFRLKKSKAS